jgi:NodT family efflux transporter outer membrane factor (OMF) lipoprotein
LGTFGALVAGCAVGPDYHSPALSVSSRYTGMELPATTAGAPEKFGASQKFVPDQDISPQWWTLFHSNPLNRLVNLGMENNPTLAAAEAALRRAGENLLAQDSALFPNVDAAFSAERQKISGAGFGQPDSGFSPFTLYNASINVSYALDIFGGTRRELEALQAQVQFQRFQVEGAYLALTANIVTSAIREASIRARILATNEILTILQQQLDLVKIRFDAGAASEVEVSAQRTQLAQTRATLPQLEKELNQTRHLLAILVGKPPDEAAGLPAFDLEGLQLPGEVPVSLPSSLVRQRPDIRAMDELLHEASAVVGVATANLYPRVTLTGGYGSEATGIGSLFSPGTSVWNLGAGLLQPLFHGGELTAKRRAAIATYEQVEARYRETVLLAFQNVADVLYALNEDANALNAQSEAATAALTNLQLTETQYAFGAVSYIILLDAARQYHQTRLGLIQAQAARLADTAALFQALGGGWWNRQETGD